jgi:hypothetical protein
MISSPVCSNNRWHRLVRQSGHVSPIPISISVILDVIALAKKRKVHTNTDRDDGNQKGKKLFRWWCFIMERKGETDQHMSTLNIGQITCHVPTASA